MLAGRRAIVLSHPSRKKRGLDGAQTIEGEPGVKYLTGPPAKWSFIAAVSLLITIFLVAGSLLVGYAKAVESRRKAEKLFAEIKSLPVGTATQEVVAKATSPFQNHRSDGVMEGATAWTFRYDNYPMSLLHLAPYASMEAIVVLKDGILQKKSVIVFAGSGLAATIEERKAGFGYAPGDDSDQVPRHRTGVTWNSMTAIRTVTIADNNLLEWGKRQKDWQISLICLDKIGGCSDARSIVPNVELEATGIGQQAR